MVSPAPGAPLEPGFFARPVGTVARGLIGCVIWCDGVAGRIVEVERYQADDPASHSFGGPTPRTAVMFGPPGRLYVYRSYGIHWCANIVCEAAGSGAAVLLRALEPVAGIATMRARRPGRPDRDLARGPGRLTRALALTGADDGRPVTPGPERVRDIRILAREGPIDIGSGPRVGISRAVDRPWRLFERGSAYLSRPEGWRPAPVAA